jgi:DNA polymerase-1
VLANALLELRAAGLGEHLLLPIHDEVLWQAPAADADEVGREIQKVMTVDFGDVTLDAETEGPWASWGSGYGAPS